MLAEMYKTAATGKRSQPPAVVAWPHWKQKSFSKSRASKCGRRRSRSRSANLKSISRVHRYRYWERRMPSAQKTCPHVNEIRQVKPSGKGCKECLEMGDT